MLNRWIRSLSARLWVTSVAALALSMTVLVTLVVYSFNRFPEQTIGGHEQMERAGDVVDGLQFDGAGHPVSVRPLEETAWLFEVVSTELKYRVLDERETYCSRRVPLVTVILGLQAIFPGPLARWAR
jgi:hypothetical protein